MAENSGKTIDEVAVDTDVGGNEKIPVSAAGTPKSVTIEKLKDYVVGAIAALTAAEATTVSGDGVYIRQNGALKPIALGTLCDAIYAYMFDKSAVGVFTRNDIVAVENGGTAKTTTIGALCDYVKTQVDPKFDIDALDEGQALADNDELAVSQFGNVWLTLKKRLSHFASYVIDKIVGSSTSTAEIGNDDYMLVLTGSPLALKRVKRSDAGIGRGNVSGPQSTTEGCIPQWDSTTNTLKDGKAIATEVSSLSTSSEIPTADVVYSAIVDGNVNKVIRPQSNNDGNIPQWGGTNSGTLKNGLAVQKSIRAAGSASDAALPTEKAVSTAIANMGNVNGPFSSVDGDIAQFNGATGKTLKGGLSISTSISHITSSTSDSKIPTEKAVHNFIITANEHRLIHAQANDLGSYSNWASVPTTGFYSGDIACIKVGNAYYLCVFLLEAWFKINPTDGSLELASD